MRKIAPALFTLIIVAALQSMGCNAQHTKDAPATTSTPIAQAGGLGMKIAYVNIDTLEANYELLKSKREEFKKKQEQMEGQLQHDFDEMNADAEAVNKKAQANTLTQIEYEAAQKRLGQMQRSLQTRKQTLADQLMKEQEDFNKDLKARLDAFLEEYNKTKQYDYVLSYSYAGSSLLYVNKKLDITKDVVDGMNAGSKNDAGKKNK